MNELNPGALDRYITGNYGEDQHRERVFTCDRCHREIPAKKDQDGYLIRRIHTVRDRHVIRQLCDRCYQRFEQGV